VVHVFLAEELGEARAASGEDERIDRIGWPLDRLRCGTETGAA
jgi:hypothetical protein